MGGTTARRLEELAREEGRLLGQVRTLEGTMTTKTAALAELGVFRAYAKIHRAYVDIADAGDAEALKRAVFLQWFEVVEPAFLTGLRGLDRGATARTMVLVDRLVVAGVTDGEMAWMFPYYYLIAEWAFPPADECPHLVSYCKTNAPEGVVRPPEAALLLGRGQMGDYWRSIR